MKTIYYRCVKQKELFVSACYLFLMILLAIFNMHPICSVFSILLLFGFALYIFNNNSEIIKKYFYLFFTIAFMLASLSICEFSSANLSEIGEQSYFVGSIPLLVIAYFFFLFFLNVADKYFDSKKKAIQLLDLGLQFHDIVTPRSKQYINALCIAADIGFLYLFLSVFRNPSFVQGVDRFEYSAAYLETHSKIFLYLNQYSQLIIIPCILAVIYGNKAFGFAGLLSYALYMFWTGNKFGPFVTVVSVFFMIQSIKEGTKDKNNKVRIVVILLVLALLSYFALSFTVGSNSVTKIFENRIAAQGQLWWKTFELTQGEAHPNQIINEIKGILFGNPAVDKNVGANYGVYNIMYLCAPSDVVDYKIETGSRYTEAGYAIALYCLGPIGPILFSIIAAFVFAFIVNKFLKSITYCQIFKAAIILRFYFLATTSLSMGIYMSFIDRISFLSYMYLILTWNKKMRLTFPIKSIESSE